MTKQRVEAAVTFTLLSCVGCDQAESVHREDALQTTQSTIWFEEVAERRGISFRHVSGFDGRFLLPEITGGGIAMIDVDGDSDLDLYFIQSGDLASAPEQNHRNELYLNNGVGYFERSATTGTEDSYYGMGTAVGDYDNDGDIDIYITNLTRNTLLQNDGHGSFTDITDFAGVGDENWGTAAAFADFDQDHDLDLFVANYLHWSPATFHDCFSLDVQTYCQPSHNNAATDRLYRNNGDGTFTNVTVRAGLTRAYGNGLGAVVADINSDGLLDIFVANDGMVNQLWMNQGDLQFIDESFSFGGAMDDDGIAKAGMGVVAADHGNDGDIDVLVVNITGQTDSLYENQGSFFNDSTSRVSLGGISRRYTRFGVNWVDFNNDGYLDLYQANGKVYHTPEDRGGDVFAEPNVLYGGQRSGRYAEISDFTEHALIHTSRGSATGDLNGDGLLDLVVVNRDAAPYLLMNKSGPNANWIAFLAYTRGGVIANGATISGLIDDKKTVRVVQTSGSYLAAQDPRVYFGLGEYNDIKNIAVQWPDGNREIFGNFPSGSTHVLQQGEAENY